jgi:hypothetical protein
MWEYIKFWIAKTFGDLISLAVIFIGLLLLLVLYGCIMYLREQWKFRKSGPLMQDMKNKILKAMPSNRGIKYFDLEVRVLGSHSVFSHSSYHRSRQRLFARALQYLIWEQRIFKSNDLYYINAISEPYGEK